MSSIFLFFNNIIKDLFLCLLRIEVMSLTGQRLRFSRKSHTPDPEPEPGPEPKPDPDPSKVKLNYELGSKQQQ